VQKVKTLKTAGGSIVCRRCSATSKRTKKQCKAPAVKGKQTCRFHGGYSTGFTTENGKLRCIEANTKFGHETREIRRIRQKKLRELRRIEVVMKISGLL
jgi:hypothetical protein